ncbi:hypothetical protein AB0D32_05760 [Micromonospora sp. NPDC048170]|uniref:hypothetical protein n=1 Tax=Micromonospora sp. NPDC048170 TaxID=3154819 RepID=UPI0033C7D2A6
MTYREIFDEAIGDAPVSTVDVDRVISRQRKAGRLRAWGASGVGAAAVLAVTLTMTLLPEPTPSNIVPAVSPAVVPTITTTAGTPEDAKRLEDALVAALVREVPNLTWPESASPNIPKLEEGASPQTTLENYSMWATVGVGGSTAKTSMVVWRIGEEIFARGRCEDKRPSDLLHYACAESTGPDGAQVRTIERTFIDAKAKDRKGEHQLNIELLRRNGTLVTMRVYNEPGQGELPLTAEQMTAVASDPAVALGPLPPGATVRPPLERRPDESSAPGVQKQIDKAVFAALRAQAPGVKAGGAEAALEDAWTGSGGDNSIDEYWGQAFVAVNGRSGLFSVQIWRKDSGLGGDLTCGPPSKTYSCTTGEGPNGERWRITTNRTGGSERNVQVRRKDGSAVWVSHSSGSEDAFALTAEQQKAIALDPAVALPGK